MVHTHGVEGSTPPLATKSSGISGAFFLIKMQIISKSHFEMICIFYELLLLQLL